MPNLTRDFSLFGVNAFISKYKGENPYRPAINRHLIKLFHSLFVTQSKIGTNKKLSNKGILCLYKNRFFFANTAVLM